MTTLAAVAAGRARRGPLAGFPLAQIPCPLCGCADCGPVRERADGVAFCECAICGLAFADPAPSAAAVRELYRGDYFGASDGAGPYRAYSVYDPAGAMAADARRWEVRLLTQRRPPAGDVIDVGCGAGRLLEALPAHGRRIGVELNPLMAERVRRRLGVTVFESPLEEGLPLRAGSAAIFAALSVIEHTPSPAAFLDEIARLLAPHGLLLLTTPNWDAASAVGDDWIGWRGQWDHLCYFSPAALAFALERRGFKLVAEGSSGPWAAFSRVRRRRPWKNLRRRLQALPLVGAHLTDWKRKLAPPALAPLDPLRADYAALYRKTS